MRPFHIVFVQEAVAEIECIDAAALGPAALGPAALVVASRAANVPVVKSQAAFYTEECTVIAEDALDAPAAVVNMH